MAERFAEEEKRVKKNRTFSPLRFFCKKGEGQPIIILDESMDAGYAIREHNIKGSDGKFGNFEICLSETMGADCPVCQKYGDKSALIMFLTVLVLREWTDKKSGEVRQYSKMLLPVKQGMFSKFSKVQEVANTQNGTLRGTYVYMEREDIDTSFAIGEPVPLSDGSLIDHYTEDDLVAEFGHEAITGRDGKVLKKKNEDMQPYDYATLFAEPTAKELAAQYGIEPAAGSEADVAKEFGNEDGEEEEGIPMAHTWAEKGAVLDTEGGEGETFTQSAIELGVDVNDFSTWEEAGAEMDTLTPDPEEEEQEEGDSSEEPDLLLLAAAADADELDSHEVLEEKASDAGLDPNDFESWVALAEAIILTYPEPEEPEEEEEEEANLTKQAADADEAEDDTHPLLEEEAKRAGLDIDDYATWGEIADAILAYDAEQTKEVETEVENNPLLVAAQEADDSEDEENKLLESIAKNAELDPDDFETWVELAESLIAAGYSAPDSSSEGRKRKPRTGRQKVADGW